MATSRALSQRERQHGANKIVTTGKRVLKADGWHDDNGHLPVSEAEWEPPMTDEEIMTAALFDPDAQPLTDAQLSRMRRVSFAKHLRWKLRLSQEEFSRRFGIPIGTLRDWEQHRSKPDQAAESYLKVIAAEPELVARALDAANAALRQESTPPDLQ